MPNEILELHKQAAAASSAQQERRQKRRARVSREMRIQPANFNEGIFEEVRSTLNVSRDGLYFVTPHERYRRGMRLRLTAANESATEAACDHLGVVVRVHRQGDGFGVAVALLNPSTRSVTPAPFVYKTDPVELEAAHYAPPAGSHAHAAGKSDPAKGGERRNTDRQPFIASTEVIDVCTGERSRVTTADLSTLGCYIDTVTPLPLDTTALLQIERGNAVVEFRARVISSHANTGMGLVFEGITHEQRALLAKWLGGDSKPSVSAPSRLPRSVESNEVREHRFVENLRFVKLVDALSKKGILNESDVASLLRDL